MLLAIKIDNLPSQASQLIEQRLFDVVPLTPQLVRGSHGLPAAEVVDRPILIGEGPIPSEAELPMTSVQPLLLRALGVS